MWSRTDQLLRLVLYAIQSAFWSGKGPEPELIPLDPTPAAPAGPTRHARDALERWRNGDITPMT